MIRLSTNLSNDDIFTQNKQDYEIALKNNGYILYPLFFKAISFIKVEKTIQTYRIRLIIGKGKSYGSHLHITWLYPQK